MIVADQFFDTNVLLYLLSSGERKADCAEQELSGGGVISVQVLNEFASVATRKRVYIGISNLPPFGNRQARYGCRRAD